MMSTKLFFPLPPLIALIFLFSPTLSQDISFPLSSPESPNFQISQKTAEYQQSEPVGSSQYGANNDDISKGVTDLGLDLMRTIRAKNGEKNWWAYSPTSIAAALYMVLLGANGKTYTELSHLLNTKVPETLLSSHLDFAAKLRDIQQTGSDKNVIKVANGLFLQHNFSVRQEYSDVMDVLYHADIYSVDFRNNGPYIKDLINSWVTTKTAGKIQAMLSDPPMQNTEFILVNSLYFKGEWAKPFPTDHTKLQDFYPDGRSQPAKLKVPVMALFGSYHYYFDPILNCEIVGIPYKGNQVYFYLILPKNSNKEKLKSLEQRLTFKEFNRLVDKAVMTDNMILAIPKMKISSEFLLNPALKEMGLTSLFNHEADLSLLSSVGSEESSSRILEEEFIFTRMKIGNKTEARRKRQVKIDAKTDPKLQNYLNKSNFRSTFSNPGLQVSQIIHKIVIEINEKGTEAAAVSAVMAQKTMSVLVKANVPFMFIIRHEPTKMALFASSVNTPPSDTTFS